ncbi:hypothetical protein GcM1_213022 [Golovinomyces cichoracearum]|uniref:Retrovirus-related Pol polyprotein from transposon TNT 1-94 n=1 Tax=Golovinomyces cichoracearum TaxID=62708 RepID=A0A420IUI8_9PEZI|nr:hypothetical protein GcM1_213022 [Golovinomyces cichoracearum]
MIEKWDIDIQFVRMDQKAGLKSEFDVHCLINGIWQEKTPTDTKEPNGAAEKSGGQIITPQFALAAVRIINRTPKRALGYLTPYELFTKRRPDLSGYRIPGSKNYVLKKMISALQKQASLSSIGYYISNSARNNFIIWLPYAKKVIASRDV